MVPGITAALAASAQLGASLTQRGVARTLAFVTPRIGADESGSDWTAAVMAADTAAIYMGAGQTAGIAAALIAKGKRADTPVAVVRDASLPTAAASVGTLSNLASLVHNARGAEPGPAVIILGEALRVAKVAPVADKASAADVERVERAIAVLDAPKRVAAA